MSNALATKTEELPSSVVQTDAAALMEVISRASRDPQTDVDKLERLMAMYERIEQRTAEQKFNQAMQQAQSEMPAIFKGQKGQNNKYATLEAISEKMKPIITKYGFALTFGTDTASLPNHYRVTCRISHNGGHSEIAHAEVPADGTGAKGGNSSMNVVQAFGSTMTYARRYLTLLIFNIATTDDDGNGAAGYITQEQAAQLADLIKDTKTDLSKFLAHMKVDCLPNIPLAQFGKAQKALAERKAIQARNAGGTK